MFALTGLEIAFFVLTASGIAVAAIALGKGQNFNPGIAVFLATIIIPVIGPIIGLLYGGNLWVRSYRAGRGA